LTKASEEKVQDIFILQTELDKAKREVTERENIITSLQSSDETHNEPLIATGSQVQRLKLDITTARADANAAKATSVEKDKHIAEFQAIAKANEEALSTQAKTLNGDIVQLKEELSHTKETLATTTTTLPSILFSALLLCSLNHFGQGTATTATPLPFRFQLHNLITTAECNLLQDYNRQYGLDYHRPNETLVTPRRVHNVHKRTVFQNITTNIARRIVSEISTRTNSPTSHLSVDEVVLVHTARPSDKLPTPIRKCCARGPRTTRPTVCGPRPSGARSRRISKAVNFNF
jgi:hypothetical protein